MASGNGDAMDRVEMDGIIFWKDGRWTSKSDLKKIAWSEDRTKVLYETHKKKYVVRDSEKGKKRWEKISRRNMKRWVLEHRCFSHIPDELRKKLEY